MVVTRSARVETIMLTLTAVAVTAGCGGSQPPSASWLTAMDRSGHAAMFTLLGTSHATTDCNACHTNPATFAVADCSGCHTKAQCDSTHLGVVTGYQFVMTACFACHKDGVSGAVNHASFFPIGSGTSHALACSDCHTDQTRPTDLTTLACATCHATRPGFSTAHAAVKDFGNTSAACLRCHADDTPVPTVAAHQARFPIAAGSATHDTVCLQCHTTLRTDKPWATDFKSYVCTTCHAQSATDPVHVGVTGYAFASASCYGCHATGTATVSPAAHAAFFPIGSGTSHALACADCHTNAATPGDTTTLACATCHATRPGFSTAHAAVKDFSNTSPACLRCHADDTPVPTVASHTKFPIASGSSTHDTVCLQCHTTLRTDKPWAADFTGYVCTTCHAQAATDPLHASVTGYAFASASCYGCHANGTAGAPANHPALFPIGTGTAHVTVACTQCHTNSATPTDTTTLACGSCHAALDAALATKHTGATIPVTDFKADSPSCLRCHADAQVNAGASHPRGSGTPSQESRHRTAGCLTCHTDTRTDKPFTAANFATAPGCITCHKNGIPN